MLDETVLRTKTTTRIVMAVEDLLKIIPDVKCPEVFHIKQIIKEHNKAIRFSQGKNHKGTIASRRNHILNYRPYAPRL